MQLGWPSWEGKLRQRHCKGMNGTSQCTWARVWGVASNPREPLGKEALVVARCKGVPMAAPFSKSLAGTAGRARPYLFFRLPPPPLAGYGGSHTLPMREHTQAIVHKRRPTVVRMEGGGGFRCRSPVSSFCTLLCRNTQRALGCPWNLLGARFLHRPVLRAYTRSGHAGPCPSACSLVLPS